MNIVFFAHPSFLSHQSMPRFAKMLSEGMTKRGHHTQVWSPNPLFFKLSSNPFIRKWLGYLDQYTVFPGEVRHKLKYASQDTLYVFTDQALGPWVPLVTNRPHVVHCHDFMALRSSLGEIPENRIGRSGKLYQQLIRRGFSKAKHFISVSNKTRKDLERFLLSSPLSSDVVYNGFHQKFFLTNKEEARIALSKRAAVDLRRGFILHVGGNLWYKNRPGVIDIYNSWRSTSVHPLPLVMIGEAPDEGLLQQQKTSEYAPDIHWLVNIEDEYVRLAYSAASVFLFPSKAEGFGWPIAEAMASGSPVITTDEAPMTEVAGDAGFLIANSPVDKSSLSYKTWASDAAKIVTKVTQLSNDDLQSVIQAGIKNARRFDTDVALDQIESIYYKIINETTPE